MKRHGNEGNERGGMEGKGWKSRVREGRGGVDMGGGGDDCVSRGRVRRGKGVRRKVLFSLGRS